MKIASYHILSKEMLQTYTLLALILTVLGFFLVIFVEIGNTSYDDGLPKNIRMVHISTLGLGSALAKTLIEPAKSSFVNASLYANPIQRFESATPNQGLRTFYTWGLWNLCAGYHSPSGIQYCGPKKPAHPFMPTATLLKDAPLFYSAALGALLADENHGMIDDRVLKSQTLVAGFLLLSVAGHLLFLVPICILLMIRRGPAILPLVALGILVPTVVSCFTAAGLWTSAISGLKAKLAKNVENFDLGINVEYGNALWMLWALTFIVFIATGPYIAVSSVLLITHSRLLSVLLFLPELFWLLPQIFFAARQAAAEKEKVAKSTDSLGGFTDKDFNGPQLRVEIPHKNRH